KGDKKYYAPIIALVDSTDATLIKNYQEIGIKSILLKPVNIRQFNKEISIALN
ncbi:MAG: hypothetical protein IT276_01950, partial [Ignavibacteriaceae bacterium]|nr:hypothetical protein [Ignavibacteriaceae bacterium]